MDIIRLGQLLHEKRIERKITLRDVEAETGIGISTLSRLEVAGKRKEIGSIPKIDTIQILTNWLGISIDSIMEIQSVPKEWTSILSDEQIVEAVQLYNMIDPFIDHKVSNGISYGLSSFGYDIRTGIHYRRLIPEYQTADLDHQNPEIFQEGEGDCTIFPYSYALLESLEYFHMPPNVLGDVRGKSSLARTGLIVSCTPLEPGWEGRLTICVVNPTPRHVRIRAGQGIAQILFFAGQTPQAQYQGKYQGTNTISL